MNFNTGITAEVVQASRYNNKVVWTLKLKYGLMIHAELLRHKLFSHSVKSNRAIEPHRIRHEVINDPYIPVRFGQNQRGMVAKGESKYARFARKMWLAARYVACGIHYCFEKIGIHKEITNRLLFPWQWVSQTLTFTEIDNFFNLRLHQAAQPDIQRLAQVIRDCLENAHANDEIEDIGLGDYHVPYVNRYKNGEGQVVYRDNDGRELSVEQAIVCSMARCARSSYNNHDGSKSTYNTRVKQGMRTDLEIYQDLIESKPVHASPGEHVCTPMVKQNVSLNSGVKIAFKQPGVTHVDRHGMLWSGCLRGWVQQRYLLEDESCWHYEETDEHIR